MIPDAEYFDLPKNVRQPCRDQGSVRTDRADRRTNRFSANKKVVTSRDHTPRSFASFRVAAKRLVVDALPNLEGTDRFGGIGGFVNVSRHRDNLLIKGLGAFLFGKRKILRRQITLGNERLISAPSDRIGVPRSASRIFAKARTTTMLTRAFPIARPFPNR